MVRLIAEVQIARRGSRLLESNQAYRRRSSKADRLFIDSLESGYRTVRLHYQIRGPVFRISGARFNDTAEDGKRQEGGKRQETEGPVPIEGIQNHLTTKGA